MKKNRYSFLFFILSFVFNYFYTQNSGRETYYIDLLTNPKEEKDLQKAYAYFQNQIKKAVKNSDSVKVVYHLYFLAYIEGKLGLLSESEQTAIHALEFQNKLKNKRYQVSIFNHLGKISREKGDYDMAIYYYKQLGVLLKLNSQDRMALYNNMGVVYSYQKKDKQAIVEFKKAYRLSLKGDDKLKQAKFLDNLGYSQSKLNIDSGILNMLKALEIRKQSRNSMAIFTSYGHLFNYYFDRNQIKEAVKYAKLNFQIANQINSYDYRLKVLKQFVDLRLDDYYLEYITLKDSIDQLEQEKSRQYISIKYNYTQQELKAKENQLLAEKEKRYKLWSWSISVVIVILLLGGFFIYREKRRKEIVEKVIQTEGRISKRVHDVIANDLYQVMVKLDTQEKVSDLVLSQLDQVYAKARDVSRDYFVLDDRTDCLGVIGDLLNYYQSDQRSITTKNLNQVNWQSISIHKKNILYRVLKELMTNMSKYSQANRVTITFKQHNKRLKIVCRDNGIGCLLIKKNGLLNVESRIESVKGKVIFESEPNKGFIVYIIL